MFAHGETVTRIRAALVEDPYSTEDTLLDWTDAPEVDIPNVAVEPRPSSEPVQDARNSVVSGFTLYMKTGGDLTPLDRVRVRGVVYDIDGEIADWRSPYSGSRPGLVVQTKRVAG